MSKKFKSALQNPCLFQVKAIPHSREQSIIKISDGAFKIRLKSAPEKGKANKELIELLARYFEISKNQVKIVR